MATVQDAAVLTEAVADPMKGHVLAMQDNSTKYPDDSATELINHTELVGVLKRWDWRLLEPVKNEYNLGTSDFFDPTSSWVGTPLDWMNYYKNHPDAQVNKAKLVVLIEDRPFYGKYQETDIEFTAPDTITSLGTPFAGWGSKSGGAFLQVTTTSGLNDNVYTIDTGSNPITTIEQTITTESAAAAGTVSVLQIAIPDYLYDEGNWYVTNSPSVGGAKWREHYINRWVDLAKAVYDAYKDHPNFGGIATQESSLSFTSTPGDYTQQKFHDAMLKQCQTRAVYGGDKDLKWYQNFLAGNTTIGDALLDDLATEILPYRVSMGGPDILRGNSALETRVYPRYAITPTKRSQFCSMQFDSYSTIYTMSQQMDYAYQLNNGVDVLDTVMWTWDTSAGPYAWNPDGQAVVDNATYAGPLRGAAYGTTAPAVSSITTDSTDPTWITITFDREISTISDYFNGFTVQDTGTGEAIPIVQSVKSGLNKIMIQVNSAIGSGDSISVRYV